MSKDFCVQSATSPYSCQDFSTRNRLSSCGEFTTIQGETGDNKMPNLPLNVQIQKKMPFMFTEPDHSFMWLHEGNMYSVAREKRGNNFYWYMRKMFLKQNYTVYVAPAGKLSAELLDNAAAQIVANASPVKQED